MTHEQNMIYLCPFLVGILKSSSLLSIRIIGQHVTNWRRFNFEPTLEPHHMATVSRITDGNVNTCTENALHNKKDYAYSFDFLSPQVSTCIIAYDGMTHTQSRLTFTLRTV